jgi:hypothetical protein
MILIIGLLTVKVSALSFTATMTSSNVTVDAASEVVITVKISNLDVGDNGINSFSAYLSYDTDVFETLTKSSIDGLNGWMPAFAPGTGRVTLEKSQFVNSDEEIMQISLKTKSGLENGTQGLVKLTRIVASNSADEISASDVSTTITIGQETVTPQPDTNTVNPGNITPTPIDPVITPNTNNTNNINNTNNTNNINNTNTNTSKNETNNKNIGPTNNTINESEHDIPYTGSDSSSLSKIILGVIFIALATYIKIERMKDI